MRSAVISGIVGSISIACILYRVYIDRSTSYAFDLGLSDSGGVIVADGENTGNSIRVKKHAQSTDEYFLFRRIIDTFTVENTGSGTVKGIFMPWQEMTYFSYYDELGTIHRKSRHGNVYVFGFRYPLKPGESISFTIETISGSNIFRSKSGREKANSFYHRKKGVCSFSDDLVNSTEGHMSEIARTYFYVWKTGLYYK